MVLPLMVAAGLLTSSGSAATTVNPTTEPNQLFNRLSRQYRLLRHATCPVCYLRRAASLPEQNLEQKVQTSRPPKNSTNTTNNVIELRDQQLITAAT